MVVRQDLHEQAGFTARSVTDNNELASEFGHVCCCVRDFVTAKRSEEGALIDGLDGREGKFCCWGKVGGSDAEVLA